jgi:hypothetical protein
MEGAVLSGKLAARAIAQDYPATEVERAKEATEEVTVHTPPHLPTRNQGFQQFCRGGSE